MEAVEITADLNFGEPQCKDLLSALLSLVKPDLYVLPELFTIGFEASALYSYYNLRSRSKSKHKREHPQTWTHNQSLPNWKPKEIALTVQLPRFRTAKTNAAERHQAGDGTCRQQRAGGSAWP
jgi:hypothetical protein